MVESEERSGHIRNVFFKSVHFLRAVASISVVSYHCDLILQKEKYGSNMAFDGVGRWGWLGVNLFFLISGFTIFHAHHRDFGKKNVVAKFVIKRFIRIYPAYWLCLFMFIVASIIGVWSTSYGGSAPNIATYLTLLPFTDHPELPLKVAWTLLYEMIFYGVFLINLVFPAVRRISWACWGVLILACNALFDVPPLSVLNVYNIYFIAGVYIAMFSLHRESFSVLFVFLTLAGAALLAFFFSSDVNIVGNNWQLLAPLFFVIPAFLLAIALERPLQRLYSNRAVILAADASYSIYLVHSAVISAIGLFQAKLIGHVPGEILYLFAFCSAISAGIVFHLIFERPMIAFLRRRLLKRAVTAAGRLEKPVALIRS